MKPTIIFADNEELSSGTNRFYGIRAIVRKFLFFKKTVTAVNSIRYNTPKKAFTELMKNLTPAEQKKAVYLPFVQSIDVHGWCCGKPLATFHEPCYNRKWNLATLLEKAKEW
jgi:hypothetical protein